MPASSSPSRTASTTSLEFWPTTRTRTPGWRRRKSATRSEPGKKRAVPQVPKVAVPPRRPRTADTESRAASTPGQHALGVRAQLAARLGEDSPRPTRVKSATPSSASSRRTCSRQRRLREVQLLGGGREGPALGGRQEVLAAAAGSRLTFGAPRRSAGRPGYAPFGVGSTRSSHAEGGTHETIVWKSSMPSVTRTGSRRRRCHRHSGSAAIWFSSEDTRRRRGGGRRASEPRGGRPHHYGVGDLHVDA